MRTRIFFFSGTGNSLYIAKELRERIKNTTLFNIKDCRDEAIVIEKERVGIVFPVYACGMPHIVERFVARLKPNENSYIFAISTSASGYGTVLQQVNTELTQKHHPLDAAFNIFMPSNYLPFGGAESRKKQQKKFTAAREALDMIAPLIVELTQTPIPRQWFLPHWFCQLSHRIFMNRLEREVEKFHVDAKRCNGCQLCLKVCPVNNITLIENRPDWGKKCEQCFACLQFCPSQAILRGRISPKRKHYHHPKIKPQELF